MSDDPATDSAISGGTSRRQISVQRKKAAFRRRISVALDDVLERTLKLERRRPLTLDLEQDRFVLFSDQHRGARNRADDFRRTERAYNTALAYYLELGYTLCVLGDAEELWEEQPFRVVEAYNYSLGLESAFFRQGRYLRLWGNHDDEWSYPDVVERHLGRFFPGIEIHEGILIEVLSRGASLGHLFLVHGHQGTSEADRYAALSRLFVRYVWRNIQRLTGYSWNTPASDWRLRKEHDFAMYRWARGKEGMVLITGHTHRPVFKSKTHAAQVEEELAAAREELRVTGDDGDRQKVAELAAELEWVRAQEQTRPGPEGHDQMERPSYFNTGCCSYLDGDITGLQIADGEIALIRWPSDEQRPRPQVLARADLADVLARTRTP